MLQILAIAFQVSYIGLKFSSQIIYHVQESLIESRQDDILYLTDTKVTNQDVKDRSTRWMRWKYSDPP